MSSKTEEVKNQSLTVERVKELLKLNTYNEQLPKGLDADGFARDIVAASFVGSSSDAEMLLFLNERLLIVASMALALAGGKLNDEEYGLNLIEVLGNIYSRINAEQTALIEAILGAVTFDNIRPNLDELYSDDALRAVLIRARKLIRATSISEE